MFRSDQCQILIAYRRVCLDSAIKKLCFLMKIDRGSSIRVHETNNSSKGKSVKIF